MPGTVGGAWENASLQFRQANMRGGFSSKVPRRSYLEGGPRNGGSANIRRKLQTATMIVLISLGSSHFNPFTRLRLKSKHLCESIDRLSIARNTKLLFGARIAQDSEVRLDWPELTCR